MQYFGCWANKQDVENDFSINSEELKGAKVHVAYYGQGDYEGTAFVLFSKGGKLWEVNGSHCSCFGLEGQWDPEETTVEALAHRLEHGTCFYGYGDEGAALAAIQRFCKRRKT